MISNLQAAPLFNNSSSVNAKYSHHETFHDMCYQENEVWLLTWLELFSPITPCVCVCVCVCVHQINCGIMPAAIRLVFTMDAITVSVTHLWNGEGLSFSCSFVLSM